MDAISRHLDLGCGERPRNPYGRDRGQLCGVDIRPLAGDGFDYRIANLALQPIPWPDSSFASVSAYDFIEHVPRVLPGADGRDTVFPFVRLMDEIWRVLIPGGKLYAVTPAWPHADAFTDPTHVNPITHRTHEYFCGESPLARMYGFHGDFRALRVEWVRIHNAFGARADAPENRRDWTPLQRTARWLRHASRRVRGKPDPSLPPKHHLLWELEAIKPTDATVA